MQIKYVMSSLALGVVLAITGTVQAESACKGLSKGQCGAGCTWVDSYKTKTGNKVSGYCRTKPGKTAKGAASAAKTKASKEKSKASEKKEALKDKAKKAKSKKEKQAKDKAAKSADKAKKKAGKKAADKAKKAAEKKLKNPK